jgi:glycosyltransferase involved in cell wall biosynthesis
MRVAQIGFFNDPQDRPPEQLLIDWPSLVEVAECASGAGVDVSVIQACSLSALISRNGVDYHFLPWGRGAAAPVRDDPRPALLADLAPDVFHVHGLDFPRDVATLAALAPGVPIVLQDHASRVPRPWRRAAWRRRSSVVCGVAFTAREQAAPFLSARLFERKTLIYELPESTNRFMPGDRAQARRATRLAGDPVILWVGHLDRNKDPLTVLEGISRAAGTLKSLQLWCCFGKAPLLGAVKRRIGADANLRGRVHLLGPVAHERIELLMRAADIFVLGSHRESCGFALMEALACGVSPVVTDIPSFRALTADGSVGALWPRDDPGALATALISVARRAADGMREAVRTHFERELSPTAVGRKLAMMYEDLARRPGHAGAGGYAGQPLAARG